MSSLYRTTLFFKSRRKAEKKYLLAFLDIVRRFLVYVTYPYHIALRLLNSCYGYRLDVRLHHKHEPVNHEGVIPHA